MLIDTESEVFPGKNALRILLTKITVVEVALQDTLLLTDPPKVELTVAVHVPVAIETSEGIVILIAAPIDSGFLTVTVNV